MSHEYTRAFNPPTIAVKLTPLTTTSSNPVQVKIFAISSVVLLSSMMFSLPGHVQDSNVPSSAGQIYEQAAHKDWKILCVNSGQEKDPCHMYQLLRDQGGHPTAEIAIHRVYGEEGISAAATVLTPLETLLTANLEFQFDAQSVSTYPFAWCHQRGCNVRIALTDDDIISMKKFDAGKIRIETISNPGSKIEVEVSYLGFTAAFVALGE